MRKGLWTHRLLSLPDQNRGLWDTFRESCKTFSGRVGDQEWRRRRIWTKCRSAFSVRPIRDSTVREWTDPRTPNFREWLDPRTPNSSFQMIWHSVDCFIRKGLEIQIFGCRDNLIYFNFHWIINPFDSDFNFQFNWCSQSLYFGQS